MLVLYCFLNLRVFHKASNVRPIWGLLDPDSPATCRVRRATGRRSNVIIRAIIVCIVCLGDFKVLADKYMTNSEIS